MTQLAERSGTYQAEFEAFRRDPAFGSGALSVRRERAFERFLKDGFPSTRDEEWRFTNVAPIAAETFQRAPSSNPDRSDIQPFLFGGVGPLVVVINGRLSKGLSSHDGLPAGVTIESVSRSAEDSALVPAGPFVNLNDAFFEDEIHIRVAPKTIVSTPIHVLALSVATGQPALVAPRLSLHVGEAAQVKVIESHAGLGPGAVLATAVTTVHLDPGAVAEHVKVQRETDTAFHMATMAVRLSRASTFASHALTFGGRIARNDI